MKCRICAGRELAHYGWCSLVGGPGRRPSTPPPEPSPSARLGHHAAPTSGLFPNGVPYLEVTSAVLCPDCLGDWCESCGFTGMSRPVEPARVVVPMPLVSAVEAWCTDALDQLRRADVAA